MQTIQILNPRNVVFSASTMAALGRWGLTPGYDTRLPIGIEGVNVALITAAKFVVSEGGEALSRTMGAALAGSSKKQIQIEGEVLMIRWSRAESEALQELSGEYPFYMEYEIEGERLLLMEGVISFSE